MWYQFAKTSAENAAWKFVNENNIDLVVINPSITIGPLLQTELNTSATNVLDLLNGNLLLFFTLEVLCSAKIFQDNCFFYLK